MTVDASCSIPNSARKSSSKKASTGSSRQNTGNKHVETRSTAARGTQRTSVPKRDSFCVQAASTTAARAPYNFSSVYQPLLMMPSKKENRGKEHVEKPSATQVAASKENVSSNVPSRAKAASISISIVGVGATSAGSNSVSLHAQH